MALQKRFACPESVYFCFQEGFYSLGRNGKNISGVNLNVRTQAAFSKLHQVYMSLCLNEIKEREESFQPTSFLHALRYVDARFVICL